MVGGRGVVSFAMETTYYRRSGNRSELHIEELNGQYSTPNIVRVIKTRRMRWAGHTARMG